MDFLGQNKIPCAFNEFFDKKMVVLLRNEDYSLRLKGRLIVSGKFLRKTRSDLPAVALPSATFETRFKAVGYVII